MKTQTNIEHTVSRLDSLPIYIEPNQAMQPRRLLVTNQALEIIWWVGLAV
jgi:hypothetical protein